MWGGASSPRSSSPPWILALAWLREKDCPEEAANTGRTAGPAGAFWPRTRKKPRGRRQPGALCTQPLSSASVPCGWVVQRVFVGHHQNREQNLVSSCKTRFHFGPERSQPLELRVPGASKLFLKAAPGGIQCKSRAGGGHPRDPWGRDCRVKAGSPPSKECLACICPPPLLQQ